MSLCHLSSGVSPEGSGTPGGKQLVCEGWFPCLKPSLERGLPRDAWYSLGAQLLPPQLLPLPLWLPRPPVREQAASVPPVENKGECGTMWRVQSP